MTSSNVSNLLVQSVSVKTEMVDRPAKVNTTDNLFEQTLRDVAGPSRSTDYDSLKNKTEDSKDIDYAIKDSNSPIKGDSKSEKIKNPESSVKVEKEKVDVEKVSEKIEEFADDVKNVIKEALDVNDEQIEEAMENLGLTVLDLLNPQNLAQLVLTLTEETDSITLVVSEEFKNIFDEMMGLKNQLLEENGITVEVAKEVFVNLDDNPSTPVAAEEDILLENINHDTDNPEGKPVSKEFADDNSKLPVMQIVDESEEKTQVKATEVQDDSTDGYGEILQTTNEADASNSDSKAETNLNGENQRRMTFKTEFNAEAAPENVFIGEQKNLATYSPVNDVVTLPSGQTVTTQEIVEQFVEQARIINTSESTTMEMTLNPEGLGKIYMEVTQKGDEIIAKIFTENDAVKQALEGQMASLRVQLNDSSQKITSIEVSVGTHEFEKNLEEGQQQNNQEERQNQPERKPTRIDLNNLDELAGPMTEEEMLVAEMMRDNGNTLNFQA